MTIHNAKPHILLIIARGEAVRNFLYSETISVLRQRAHITLLSVLNDADFLARFQPQVDEIIELKDYRENWLVLVLRELIGYAHYRWIWTEKVKNKWQILDSEAVTPVQKITHSLWKILIYLLANRPALDFLAQFENFLSLWFNPTLDFNELFDRIKPDLVFNASHIHAPRGELPVRVAHQMGIRTATFVFSWDNLSSRGRILPHYDHFLVWHHGMCEQLLKIYPFIRSNQVTITGTPQFDYHFQPEFWLTREQLCEKIGADPHRPLILYTTGKHNDFPEEHLYVQEVVRIFHDLGLSPVPQLIVRNYIKGTSAEMIMLSKNGLPDTVFPPVLWEEKWFTPQYEDLAIYTGLLRHCVMGINAASTVSLELMMHDKPVINLGFDPPGSHIPPGYHWSRHIDFDHYRSVVSSGGVMVARSTRDLSEMIARGLEYPETGCEVRQRFITATFGDTLDGKSGQRAAEVLLSLAETEHLKKEAKQHA